MGRLRPLGEHRGDESRSTAYKASLFHEFLVTLDPDPARSSLASTQSFGYNIGRQYSSNERWVVSQSRLRFHYVGNWQDIPCEGTFVERYTGEP